MSRFFRTLAGYIRDRIKTLIFLCLSAAVLIGVFLLQGEPLSSLIYGLLLCAFLGLILGAAGFLRYLRKHTELSRLLRSPLSGNDILPEPNGLIERDYDEIIRRIASLRADERAARDAERHDTHDYYSLWAHQIKVPISAMQLLLREEKNGSALSGELFRIEQYVEMALGYERLNSQSNDYVIREYSLDDIIKQAARRFAPLFIRKKLSLVIEPTGLRVITDEKWLAFILEQLLSNAVKYTKSGRVSICRDGSSQRIIISDTGIGIGAEDLPRVFERGYTGYNGRADKRATGLGLYLCKSIADRLGHGIAIDSAEGRGTAVTLDFSRESIPWE